MVNHVKAANAIYKNTVFGAGNKPEGRCFFCFVLDLCLFFHRMSTLSILQVNDIEDDDDSFKNNNDNNKVDFW